MDTQVQFAHIQEYTHTLIHTRTLTCSPAHIKEGIYNFTHTRTHVGTEFENHLTFILLTKYQVLGTFVSAS